MTAEEMANQMMDQIIRDAEDAPIYRAEFQRVAAMLAMIVQDLYGGGSDEEVEALRADA